MWPRSSMVPLEENQSLARPTFVGGCCGVIRGGPNNGSLLHTRAACASAPLVLSYSLRNALALELLGGICYLQRNQCN